MTIRIACSSKLRALLGLCVGLVLCEGGIGIAAPAGPAAVTAAPPMVLRDGKLTAELVAAPLPRVMEEIGRLSGAEVSWIGPVDEEERVSTSFVDLPLAQAIGRLLPTRSFEIVVSTTAESSRLRRILILPGGRSSPPVGTAPSVSVRQDPEPAQGPIDALDDMLRAQEAPVVRLEAVSQLAVLAVRNPDARNVLAQLSADDADDTVRERARQALDEAFRGDADGGGPVHRRRPRQ